MFRRPTLIAFSSIAAVAAVLAIPSLALAGNPATSPVDSVAASTASGTSTPTDSAPSKTSVDSSDSPTASTYAVPTPDPCAPVPTKDGSSGSSTSEGTVPTTCTDVPVPPTTEGTPVAGGGDVETVDAPEPVDVVAGSGEDPVAAAPVSGGGGPELPFTGLPLIYVLYAGIGFMVLGAGLWLRMRRHA